LAQARFWTESKIGNNGAVSSPTPIEPADLLRQHGLQVTAQRLAVLRAASTHPHSTADDLAEIVRDEIGAISRQSVYDSLGVLVDKGVLLVARPAQPADPAPEPPQGRPAGQ
jgi:hypothetical protein